MQRGKSEDAAICRWRQEKEDCEILKLIVPGAAVSKMGQVSVEEKEKGRKFAVGTLMSCFHNASEATVIDPFIFRRSQGYQEEPELTKTLDAAHAQAQAILDILGKKDVVHFYYKAISGHAKTKVSTGVADYIEKNIGGNIKKFVFHVVNDLHDRVWIRKTRNDVDSAKVVGTSLDGIGKRPTYLIDMPSTDLPAFITYVKSLSLVAQTDTNRPMNFKKPVTRLAR